MSEGSGHKIHALSLPLAAGGLSVNPAVLDQSRDSLVPPMMTKQENDDCFTARPITPRWNHCRQVSANHVNFLSARQGLHHAVPAGDIPKGIVLPIGSSESGKQPVVDRCSVNMLKDYESWILTRNLASSKQQLEKKKCTVSQPHHVVTGAMPSFSSNPSCRAVKVTSSRKRRARIAEGLKALEELVPNPTEGGKEAVLDDIIDHIKFLKLQLKGPKFGQWWASRVKLLKPGWKDQPEPKDIKTIFEKPDGSMALSQSRLGGEAIADPFLYLEGYGHYLLHEQLLGDPLEEIMGEMMETDMAAAIELLNSKGISIIPMALANDLIQSG